MKTSRRNFIKRSAITLAGASVIGSTPAASVFNTGENQESRIKEYRRLGRTGFSVSDIGCGTPMIQDENFLKSLLKRGVNYLDTAKFYQNGNSERMIGRAINDFERESIFISTKLHITGDMSVDDIVSEPRDTLGRLDSGYIDCLEMHCPTTAQEVRNPSFQKAIQKLKKDGVIHFCGISCHGQSWYDESDPMDVVLDAAVDEGYYDLFLLVYNYIQRDKAEYILKRCKEQDIATTLMKTNPFGGSYVTVQKAIDQHLEEGKEMPAWLKILHEKFSLKQEKALPFLQRYGIEGENETRDAAIRFVLNNPDVHSVLISFQNFSDVNDYLNLSGSRFNYTDKILLQDCSEELSPLYCRHACGDCETVCPYKVPVNTIMRYNHYFTAQKREKYAMEEYASLKTENAARCFHCDAPCEKACPYNVNIHVLLYVAHRNLRINIA